MARLVEWPLARRLGVTGGDADWDGEVGKRVQNIFLSPLGALLHVEVLAQIHFTPRTPGPAGM